MPFHYILWTGYHNTHTHTHTSELKPLYQSALLSCYRHILSSVYSSRASLRCDGPRGAPSIVCGSQLSRGLKPARAESADTTPPPHPPAFTLTHAHARSCGGCYFHPNTTVSPPPLRPARRGDASTQSSLAHNKAHEARCQGSSRRLRAHRKPHPWTRTEAARLKKKKKKAPYETKSPG